MLCLLRVLLVQSKEEALAALVKARCTLDDFEPALKILATDEASPESIDTWTLQQVCLCSECMRCPVYFAVGSIPPRNRV